jgi:hypothetical protein
MVVAVAALLGFAGIAAGALSVRSDSVTVDQDLKGSATAECPRGSEAVSGGFASPDFDPKFNDASIIHFDSHRTSAREWQSQAHNYGDASGELDAYAVCDSKAPPIVVKTETKSVSRPLPVVMRSDPKGVGTAIARCPKGSEAVSGGFASPNNADQGRDATYPFTSKRVGDRKWKVRAINNDFQHRRRLKAFAYCDKSEPGLDVKSDQVAVPDRGKRTLDLGCRHGEKPLSGGYASTIAPDADSAAFAFTSRPISGDRWRVSAFGSRSGGGAKLLSRRVTAGTLTAFVYCK